MFCGSNSGNSAAFVDVAIELGRAMVSGGIGLVYGGGRVGLMGAVADAVLAAGGEAIGVMPAHMVEREVAHRGLTSLEVTSSMHERKARMAELADGFVALPGGFGTFEEVIEVLTWNQLGLLAAPVVLLDVDGFYAPLFAAFDRAVDDGFLRASHRRLARRATDVAEALTLATEPASEVEHKWIDLDRT